MRKKERERERESMCVCAHTQTELAREDAEYSPHNIKPALPWHSAVLSKEVSGATERCDKPDVWIDR